MQRPKLCLESRYDSCVIVRASLSALHVLALAIGFGAVFARGRRLRDLRRSPEDAGAPSRLFQADSLWGAAALLWIATGLLRVFGRLLNDAEVAIVLLIPFTAALMARGAWLF